MTSERLRFVSATPCRTIERQTEVSRTASQRALIIALAFRLGRRTYPRPSPPARSSRSYAQHLPVRDDDRGVDEEVAGRVRRHLEPGERVRRRPVDDVSLDVEAAPVARAGDDGLVGQVARDAAEVRADGREGVD